MWFICRCGERLSTVNAPNDVQLRVYSDKEWEEEVNIGIIDSINIPLPKYDVWHCKRCDRVYVFNYGEGPPQKVYIPEQQSERPVWDEFLKTLRCYSGLFDDLNSGCTQEEINRVESGIGGIKLPDALSSVYLKNNGQKGISEGIFKTVSGYNKYSRLKFLSIDSVARICHQLSQNKAIDVFKETYIPFAVDNEKNMGDVLCIDSITGEVLLLWLLVYDPLSPVEWQTTVLERGKSFDIFLQRQIEMY